MLRLLAGTSIAALLATPLNPTAAGADSPDIEAGECRNQRDFCVGAGGKETRPGKGAPAEDEKPAGKSGGGKSDVECELTKIKGPSSPNHPVWKDTGGDPKKDRDRVYFRACNDAAGDIAGADGFVVLPDGEDKPQVDPVTLAYRAVDRMKLTGPRVLSPKPEGKYVVGMPMWLQVAQNPTGYGPNSASASAGGVTVTARATVSQLVWEMGDGSSVTCTSAGTAYDPSRGKAESPDCGHTYRTSSKNSEGKAFHGTVTATWTVDWSGGGEQGTVPITRSSRFDAEVGEAKALH